MIIYVGADALKKLEDIFGVKIEKPKVDPKDVEKFIKDMLTDNPSEPLSGLVERIAKEQQAESIKRMKKQ